jgi:hypothetical protein
MAYNKFLYNLEKYKKYEVISSELIKERDNVEIVRRCDNFKYDFKTSKGFKYEVKCDEASLKYGNYFIEFMGYGKPTGITTTKAHYYILCDTINYYEISVEKLKEIIKLYGHVKKTTADGSTYGHLIECSIINDVSIKLN